MTTHGALPISPERYLFSLVFTPFKPKTNVFESVLKMNVESFLGKTLKILFPPKDKLNVNFNENKLLFLYFYTHSIAFDTLSTSYQLFLDLLETNTDPMRMRI
jgi:hypothetical protein